MALHGVPALCVTNMNGSNSVRAIMQKCIAVTITPHPYMEDGYLTFT